MGGVVWGHAAHVQLDGPVRQWFPRRGQGVAEEHRHACRCELTTCVATHCALRPRVSDIRARPAPGQTSANAEPACQAAGCDTMCRQTQSRAETQFRWLSGWPAHRAWSKYPRAEIEAVWRRQSLRRVADG